MSKKPIIGITPLYDIERQSSWILSEYINAIEYSGGIPVVLSINNTKNEHERLLEVLDGVLFPGGQDISPLQYGESILDVCGPIVPFLDETEMTLARMAYECGKPIMGICRGSQMLNVALGGTLHQEISLRKEKDTMLIHWLKDKMPKDYPIHSVQVSRDSRLFDCLGKDMLMVNSLHHQSVKALAPGLKVVASSDDGIVECVESIDRDKFLMGIQWHPELLFQRDEDSRKIFKYFIERTQRV